MMTIAILAVIALGSWALARRFGHPGRALAVGLLAGTTLLTFLRPRLLAPLWFEDVVTLDFAFLAAALFSLMTRSLSRRERLFAATLLAGSTGVTLVLAELILHFAPKTFPDHLGARLVFRPGASTYQALVSPVPDAERRRILAREGRTIEDLFDLTDRHPIPSPDAPRGSRVLVLGDSMVQGFGVDRSLRFSERLETSLGIPHYNLAMAGASMDFQLRIVERFLDVIAPNLVILGFFPGNDCYDFIDGHRETPFYFHPLYSLRGGDLVEHSFTERELWFYSLAANPPPLLLQVAARITLVGSLLEYRREGAIHSFGRGLANGPDGLEAPGASVSDPMGAAGVCAAMRRIDSIVRSKGSRMLVVVIPLLGERLGDPKVDEMQRQCQSGRCRSLGLECLSQSGIPYVDARDTFGREAPRSVAVRMLHPDRIHLSAEGHAQMAAFLAPIERRLLASPN